MSGDIRKFLEEQKHLILNARRRLSLSEDIEDEREIQTHNFDEPCLKETEFDVKVHNPQRSARNCSPKSSISEPHFRLHLDLPSPQSSNNESCLEERKKYLSEQLSNSGSPFAGNLDPGKAHLIRYGEFSPNNPQIRASSRSTAPYLGVGEYDQIRKAFRDQERADYLRHISQKSAKIKELSKIIDNKCKENTQSPRDGLTKSVQTDIQDIRAKLVQYDYRSQNYAEKELSPRSTNESYNSPLVMPNIFTANEVIVNTPKAATNRSFSYLTDTRPTKHVDNCNAKTFLDGFSYSDPKDDLEKERLKREVYQRELRLQIEEKRRLQAIKEEKERLQKEKENRRLEEQLRHMQMDKETEPNQNKRTENVRRHIENLKLDLPVVPCHKRRESECNSSSSFERIGLNSNISNKQQPNAIQYAPYLPLPRQEPMPRLRSQSCTSVNSNLKSSSSRSILAQLGDIRAQLRHEQQRMDETMKIKSYRQMLDDIM